MSECQCVTCRLHVAMKERNLCEKDPELKKLLDEWMYEDFERSADNAMMYVKNQELEGYIQTAYIEGVMDADPKTPMATADNMWEASGSSAVVTTKGDDRDANKNL